MYIRIHSKIPPLYATSQIESLTPERPASSRYMNSWRLSEYGYHGRSPQLLRFRPPLTNNINATARAVAEITYQDVRKPHTRSKEYYISVIGAEGWAREVAKTLVDPKIVDDALLSAKLRIVAKESKTAKMRRQAQQEYEKETKQRERDEKVQNEYGIVN